MPIKTINTHTATGVKRDCIVDLINRIVPKFAKLAANFSIWMDGWTHLLLWHGYEATYQNGKRIGYYV